LEPGSTLDVEVIEMSKRNRINAAVAAAIATCTLAASAPATNYAHAIHGAVVAVMVEPGGGGH
jgi:hypothetical protein